MDSVVIRQLSTSRGIITLKIPSFIGTENLLNDAIKHAETHGFIAKGDRVVCLLGHNEDTPDQVNIIKVTTI